MILFERNKNNNIPYLFMAPMAGFTDIPTRRIMRNLGADVVVTELASCDGLVRGNNSNNIIKLHKDEFPVGIQLFGSDERLMLEAAYMSIENEQPSFIDVNAGCPVPKVVKKGAGSGFLRDIESLRNLEKILTTLKKNIKIPLTVKVRSGWNDVIIEDIASVINNSGVDAVFFHPRLRKQGYTGFADWSLVPELKSKIKVPLIGNGDIVSLDVAIKRNKLLDESGSHVLDGLMIGRYALKDPFIFYKIKKYFDSNFKSEIKNFYDLFATHLEYIKENENYSQHSFLVSVKKILVNYSSSKLNVKEFRKQIIDEKDAQKLIELGFKFFKSLHNA